MSRHFRLATRSARLAANILDSLAVMAPALCGLLLGVILSSHQDRQGGALTWLPMALGGIGSLSLLVYSLSLYFRHGQSLGKRRLGLQIVTLQGEPANLGRLLGRGVSTFVFQMISLIQLADILFIFGEARRCLHDYVAGTIVVDQASLSEAKDDNIGFSHF